MSPARPLSSRVGTTERAQVGMATSRGSLQGGTRSPSARAVREVVTAVARSHAISAPATAAHRVGSCPGEVVPRAKDLAFVEAGRTFLLDVDDELDAALREIALELVA